MHTEEEYEGASLGLTREEALRQVNEQKQKREKNQDGLRRLAEALSRAHVKYFQLFGIEPHGTIQQMMAMLELCPEAKEYVRLYEQSRDRSLTE